MSDNEHPGSGFRRSCLALLAGLVPFCLEGLPPLRAADEPTPAAAKRTPVGVVAGGAGMGVRRQAWGQPWQLLGQKETLYSGDLLLGAADVVLESRNGAVRVALLGDLAELSPYPIHESAVRLHDAPGADLDFTLDRGRVNVLNHKEKGPAQVRLHVRQETWDLTLQGPGSAVALELDSRWPRGVPFTLTPGPRDVPGATLVVVVVRGDVLLKHGGYEHAMKAPPGPAVIEWDNVTGQDATPGHLDKLPPWAEESAADTPLARQKKAALARFGQAVAGKGIDAALDDFLNSNDEEDRRLAVFTMAALDDMPALARALGEAKHPDVTENGILALRHWIGRGPGQDQQLYRGLIEVGKYSPAAAETIVQLLHSFGDAELARPETYEALVDYLDSDQLPVRGLACWHLSRLVPAGKEFGYNPLAPKEERQAAVTKWKKLIPGGRLPPRPRAEGSK